jgi:hypothetical protein
MLTLLLSLNFFVFSAFALISGSPGNNLYVNLPI